MNEAREEHRRKIAELAAEDRRKRAAAEPEIARKEAALAKAQRDLQRVKDENDFLEAELDALKPDPANDDAPS